MECARAAAPRASLGHLSLLGWVGVQRAPTCGRKTILPWSRPLHAWALPGLPGSAAGEWAGGGGQGH